MSDSRVVQLELIDNQLTGSIPAELGNLTKLQTLSLINNQLTGRIPPELGNLTNLQMLNLDKNQLTGSIPPALGNLTKLRALNLTYNRLTGSIPPALGNLTNLWVLDLSDNRLTGCIPSSLRSLKNIDLSSLPLPDCAPDDKPTATPIAERPGPRFTVARDVVNVRQGPGTNFSIIGTVNAGTQFDISGKNPAGDWLQFCCLNGKRGWIYAPLTQVENPQLIPTLEPATLAATATPVATDRSRPPTPEQAAYVIEITANVEDFSTALIEIGSLFESPRIGDEDWTWALGFYLVFIRETYESALEISPPASLQNAHSTYIEGVALCNQATYLIVEALDNRDTEKFNNAGGLMRECSSRVLLASQMLDEAMPSLRSQ